MKGSPLVRALVTLGVLLLFGLPVRWVMRVGVAESGEHSERNGSERRADAADALAGRGDLLEVESTAEMKRLVVRHLGAELFRVEGGARSAVAKLPVPSGEGADLSVEVEWVSAGAAAVRVRRVPADGAAPVDRFVWGTGGGVVEEVVVFPEG